MKLLIIGGPHDGNKVEFAGETLQAFVIKPVTAFSVGESYPTETKAEYAYYRHEFVRIGSNQSETFNFYVHDSISLGEAIQLLIDGYLLPKGLIR